MSYLKSRLENVPKDPKNIFLMHHLPTNTGSVAMAEAAIISLKNKYPEALITIESDYPDLTKKMFSDVRVVKRAFSIAELTITKKILSFEFIFKNLGFIARTIWIFLVGLIVGAFRIKRVPNEGLSAMINSDLVLSLAGDSISQYYSYTLRFFEFWIINRFRIPNILYAQSVGPFDGFARRQARIGLNLVTAIIARDEETVKLMKKYKIRTPVYQSVDLAIALPTIENKKNEKEIRKYFSNKKEVVGVVIRTNALTKHLDSEYLDYTKETFKVLKYITSKGIDVLFIPTIKADYNAMIKFRKDFDLDIPIIRLFDFKASEAKGILQKLNFVISPRMHPVILSSSSDGHVPVIGLGREFKMFEYLKLINHDDYFVNFLSQEKGVLLKKVKKMIENRNKNSRKISKRMKKMKRISKNSVKIIADVYSKKSG